MLSMELGKQQSANTALFSLKYHRLHPEYIYTRIQNLQGKYQLRVLLTMVDISNHEDPLRELSKTSLVNNVTLVLCWSAAEAARYLELYKSYESNTSFAAIRGQQSSSYSDRLVDFVTVPRSLNKSDAVALVANFGSLKNAVNADTEQLGMMGGWGGVKVKRWTKAVEEPFRAKKAAKRAVQKSASSNAEGTSREQGASRLEQAIPLSRVPLREMSSHAASSRGTPANSTPDPGTSTSGKQFQLMGDLDDEDDEDAMLALAIEESKKTSQLSGTGQTLTRQENQVSQTSQQASQTKGNDELSGGVAAALARLRDNRD
jgi:DNA excision repair protein ERCC-1